MQSISSGSRNRSRFSNFAYPINKNPTNGFRTASFAEILNKNHRNQTSSPKSLVNLNYFKKNSPGESRSRLNLVTFKHSTMLETANNALCEGDKEETADYESVLTQKDLESLPFDRTFNVYNFMQQEPNLNIQNSLLSGSALTKAYLEKNSSKMKRSVTEVRSNGGVAFASIGKPRSMVRSQSYGDKVCNLDREPEKLDPSKPDSGKPGSYGQNYPIQTDVSSEKTGNNFKASENTQTELKTKKFSFMSPTISSEHKNQSLEIKNLESFISMSRKVRTRSPKQSSFPRFNKSSCHYPEKQESNYLEVEKHQEEGNSESEALTSSETALIQSITKLRDVDWNMSLRGLAEIVELSKILETDVISPHMTVIYQRLIELIKSPRSHVSRTSCQSVGHIFEFIKDTRRPEFDELVDSLLCKCADSNKFIRQDANLALDCMVTHIPTFHAVRAICSKGPEHKNPLVRTAAARILVCAIVLAGPQAINNPSSNEHSRKRIIIKMAGFLEDRSPEVRKYGERVYKMLSKDKIFDLYLNRYLEKDVIVKMRKIMKDSNFI